MKAAISILLLCSVINAVLADETPAPSAQTLDNEALAAYAQKDYRTFAERMKSALALRPTSQRFLYNLADGLALVGDAAGAFAQLREAATLGYSYPRLAEDADFNSVRDTAEFRVLAQRLAENAKPLVHSTNAFTLPEKGLVTEGLAYDAETKSFFVGSVYRRKILRIDEQGAVSDFSTPDDHLWSVLGMKVDPARRMLWACTASHPQMQNADPRENGTTALVQYDLRTGKLARKVVLPNTGAKHLLGDLTVNAAGDVYATDSITPGIYRLGAGSSELELFLADPQFENLQGLVFSKNEQQLLVADYLKGLFVIDLASKRCLNLSMPAHTALMGIDGLYPDEQGGLIAVQNGITPNRIVRLELSSDWHEVRALTVLESNNPIWDEPTLGVVANGSFYFNAVSQWGAVNEKGELAPAEKLREALILKIKL